MSIKKQATLIALFLVTFLTACDSITTPIPQSKEIPCASESSHAIGSSETGDVRDLHKNAVLSESVVIPSTSTVDNDLAEKSNIVPIDIKDWKKNPTSLRQLTLDDISVSAAYMISQSKLIQNALYIQYLDETGTPAIGKWNLSTGKRLANVKINANSGFQLHNEMIVSYENNIIHYFDLDLEPVKSLSVEPAILSSAETVPQLSFDGQRLLWINSTKIPCIYDIQAKKVLQLNRISLPKWIGSLSYSYVSDTASEDVCFLIGDIYGKTYSIFYDFVNGSVLQSYPATEDVRQKELLFSDLRGLAFYRQETERGGSSISTEDGVSWDWSYGQADGTIEAIDFTRQKIYKTERPLSNTQNPNIISIASDESTLACIIYDDSLDNQVVLLDRL